MNKRSLKIARLYAISLLCIVFYFLLENSNIIAELVQKSERGRYGSFPTFFLSGLFKYGLFFIGLGIFIILSFLLIKEKIVRNSDIKSNKKTFESTKNQKENRNLRLTVFRNFGQDEKIISEKTTSEIIKNTMNSINWNEFHIVELKDENDNALHISGSLNEDGLASTFTKDDEHILMIKPIETVEQMTEILLDFLKGEDIWQNKYKYE
ncbi:hypothetical protein [Psychroserpens mesophilus]|uniref:hypothetical protein n=1 Tax=Psychroserpens mesophilus TaxID=325473 RepID=UPI000A9CE343|nr:hypothetical protein [Psychroserpens mesophilus]